MRAASSLLLLLSACMAMPPEPVASPSPVSSGREVLAEEVVRSGNSARRENGVGALSVDGALTRAASEYAIEIAGRRELSHTSQREGHVTVMDRIERAGGKVMRAGENLAAMTVRADMPNAVIDMWLDSPGHRRNLLNPAYTITGAGAARDVNGMWYFVQVYGAPMERR